LYIFFFNSPDNESLIIFVNLNPEHREVRPHHTPSEILRPTRYIFRLCPSNEILHETSPGSSSKNRIFANSDALSSNAIFSHESDPPIFIELLSHENSQYGLIFPVTNNKKSPISLSPEQSMQTSV